MSSTKSAGWGSRVGLILAMAGNAVGLGNFLRFPVQAVENGGGAFIIPYIVCFLLMGIPLLFVEWSVGRFGGKSGHHSTPFILDSMDKRKFWKYIGVFGIFTNLAVASYYCYIESWTLSYVWHSISDTFGGKSQGDVADFFGNYVSLNEPSPIIFWVICLILNTWILSRGLSGGVERAAKIGMPLLLVFGAFLAFKAINITEGTNQALFDGTVGLDFLWKPNYSSIWDSKVWLAAAGQIFFTLSIGMGSIQCYSSYLKKNEDVALNAMGAGWMNGFVEIVLGSSIIIPIAVGYLGVDGMKELLADGGGFGLGFKTLPYLFEQWGSVAGVIAGVSWFGLLFFAGITSSLAMGTPIVGFLKDEFSWKEKNAAWLFGLAVFILGLPTVLFFNYGVFDEYDYWAGTVSLVTFAFVEIILFAWVFGMDRGWAEITEGADIRVPVIFRYIIKYVTPLLLGWVFFNSLPDIGKTITHEKSKEKIATYSDESKLMEQKEKLIESVEAKKKKGDVIQNSYWEDYKGISDADIKNNKSISAPNQILIMKLRDTQRLLEEDAYRQEKIDQEEKTMLYKNISRVLLLLLWLGIAYLVYLASTKTKKSI